MYAAWQRVRVKTAKIQKLPLQKGRADVAALTTGIDEKVYCN